MTEALGYDHAGVSVADLERSRRFYAEVLGFDRVEHAFELPALGLRGLVLLNAAGVRVELFEREGSIPAPRRAHPAEGALLHGWFQWGLATRDLDALFGRVVAAGATPVLPPCVAPDDVTRIAFIADPDGNLVELVQRASDR